MCYFEHTAQFILCIAENNEPPNTPATPNMWNGCIRMLCSAWNTIMKLNVPEIPRGIPSENACSPSVSKRHGLSHIDTRSFFITSLHSSTRAGNKSFVSKRSLCTYGAQLSRSESLYSYKSCWFCLQISDL